MTDDSLSLLFKEVLNLNHWCRLIVMGSVRKLDQAAL